MEYFVYILKCKDGTLYTGITTDVKRRLGEHNGKDATKKLGAKYTKARRPVKLVFEDRFKNRSEALKEESRIKKLKREDKLKLIKS